MKEWFVLTNETMNKEDFDSSMKHNGFKVPENYFEQLDERVLQQLQRTHKPGTLFLPLMKKMSIAAAIFLASGIAVFLYQQNQQNTLSIDNANIAETEYQEFQNNIEINSFVITSRLSIDLVIYLLFLIHFSPKFNICFQLKQ